MESKLILMLGYDYMFEYKGFNWHLKLYYASEGDYYLSNLQNFRLYFSLLCCCRYRIFAEVRVRTRWVLV